MYLVRIYKNNMTKSISLPALLCRGLGFSVGDTLMLEPLADGTIKIYPPKAVQAFLSQTRKETAELILDDE